jgi:hypothetical protein
MPPPLDPPPPDGPPPRVVSDPEAPAHLRDALRAKRGPQRPRTDHAALVRAVALAEAARARLLADDLSQRHDGPPPRLDADPSAPPALVEGVARARAIVHPEVTDHAKLVQIVAAAERARAEQLASDPPAPVAAALTPLLEPTLAGGGVIPFARPARALRPVVIALVPLLVAAAAVAVWYAGRSPSLPPLLPDPPPLAACRDLALPEGRPRAADPAEQQRLAAAHAGLRTEPAATLAQLDADQQRYGKDIVWEEREALAVRAMLCLHARGQVSLEDVAPRVSALASGAAPDSPLRAAIAELAAEVSRKLKDEGLEEPSPEPSRAPPVAPSAPSSAPQQLPPPAPPRRVWRDGRLK